MLLSRLTSLSRVVPNVANLTNLFQKCLISSTPAFNKQLTTPQSIEIVKSADAKDPVNKINEQINSDSAGRLYAIIQLCGKQFKITQGDVVMVEGYWPPLNGDKVRLEKVLLCGGQDFTLIGRPLLQKGLVDVQATIIEKSLSHTRVRFKFKKRKQYRRINFQRSITTMLRINSIDISEAVESRKVKMPTIENIFQQRSQFKRKFRNKTVNKN